MRNRNSLLLLAPAVLAAAAFTSQSVMAASTLHVPFGFMASGQRCPAGDYLVRSGNLGTSVSLEGPDGKMFFVAGPGKPHPQDQGVILSFDREAQTYLLRSVQYGPNITNRLDKPSLESIPVTKQVTGAE